MIKHHIKIAWRNLARDRFYSVIHLLGLTLGMTSFILLGKYIQHELSYDRHHEQIDQMYRAILHQAGNEFRGTELFNATPMPLAQALMDNVPAVTKAGTVEISDFLLRGNDQSYYHDALLGDANLTDIFTLPVLEGALNVKDRTSIALTRTLAQKYFGQESAIGKQMTLDSQLLIVTAVVADPPATQHFQYDFILSLEHLPYYQDDIGRWGSNNYRTYLTLNLHSNPDATEKKINEFLKETLAEAYRNAPYTASVVLQPVKDIHLHSDVNFEFEQNGSLSRVILIGSLAFIILLLAVINYMNLSTARSVHRAKEVGMRKVLGARSHQLIGQFLGESTLLTVTSLAISFAVVPFLLPSFSELIDRQISEGEVGQLWILPVMVAIALATGIGAGLYPATVLSNLKPVQAFSGQKAGIGRIGSFGNLLVVGQFMAAITLGIGSLVVYDQLRYIQEKELGYARESILRAGLPDRSVIDQVDLVRNQLLADPSVRDVSLSTSIPLGTYNQGPIDRWENNAGEQRIFFYRYHVDPHFLRLYDIEIVEGDHFDHAMMQDSTVRYILNQSALKALNWSTAVGKAFNDGVVVGVVKDFHFQPFDLAIEPLFIRLGIPDFVSFAQLSVKVENAELQSTYAALQGILQSSFPEYPIEFEFVDDAYGAIYRSEQKLAATFRLATGIAMAIACMGLLGIIAHRILQRTKEIGIRKVLGASMSNIVALLSTDLLKLICISFLLACPVAYYLLSRWLEDFAYHVPLKPQIFMGAGLSVIVVAMAAMALRAAAAARANPIKALSSNE